MKIETRFGTVEVTDIPVEEKLTSVTVNLQDQTVELTYRGFIPYGSIVTVDGEGEVLQQAPDTSRYATSYDGETTELPEVSVTVEGSPDAAVTEYVDTVPSYDPPRRPVRDSPQA